MVLSEGCHGQDSSNDTSANRHLNCGLEANHAHREEFVSSSIGNITVLDDTLAVARVPSVLALQVRIGCDWQRHQALGNVEVILVVNLASKASFALEFLPQEVRSIVHILEIIDKDRFALVALSGIFSLVIADPAGVANIRNALKETSSCVDNSRLGPGHLLVVQVAIVVEGIVLAWALFKLEFEYHFREVSISVEQLAATKI